MSRTILVVDDEPFVNEFLATLLQEEGYEVEVAIHGLDALVKLQQHKPDLILLDMMMPFMDGYAFMEELNKHEQWADIPIFVLTASQDAYAFAETQLGSDCCMRKPFEVDELLARVNRLIQST
jgi:CheY-like chemotaxis protein